MTFTEATAIDRELMELRNQVVGLVSKLKIAELSWCNTGEALSCLEYAVTQLRIERLQLIQACNKVIHGRMEYPKAREFLNAVVGEVTG